MPGIFLLISSYILEKEQVAISFLLEKAELKSSLHPISSTYKGSLLYSTFIIYLLIRISFKSKSFKFLNYTF